MELPVYLFTGFLEAGKTKFIQETLEDDRFNAGERTLLLLCEEGLEEYEPDQFSGKNVFIEVLDEPDQLNADNLARLQMAHNVERCVIEYNGMWMLDDLYQNMPEDWLIYQEICFADGRNFINYNANMRQLVYDKLKSCELLVVNRAPADLDRMEVHKIVRGASRNAQIAYEDASGDVVYDEIEDPLPFDLDAPIVQIEDEDYALWYRDISEDPKKYGGKTIRIKGMVVCSDKLPAKSFLCGRYLMTCCEADIEYTGLVCQWEQAATLKTKQWVHITAKVVNKFSPVYGKRGPVLTIEKVEPTVAPEQEVATF